MKNVINSFLKFCCLSFLFGCGETAIHIEHAERVKAKFIKKVKLWHNMQVYMTGGAYCDNVKKINLGFIIRSPYSLDEARKIYLSYVLTFLEIINHDLQIRPYLETYPATVNNLDLCLSFREPGKDSYFKSPNIACITTYKNRISYCKFQGGKLDEIYQETFDEALRKL